jgi:acetyl esterase/lipase
MKMEDNGDGTYSFVNAKRYAKFIDIETIPYVHELYTYKPDRLHSSDYKGVRTQDIVFKKGPDYELKMTVDFSDDTQNASPFMIYIHGGGWARGDNSSSKTLSQYLAKQHGITGFRVEYVLAGQTDATVEVSIQDILDAYAYIINHAKELNVDPSRFGFLGTSAGSHLAAVAAMKTKAKALVGYSGIYDLTTAYIVQGSRDKQRIAYFLDRDETILKNCSGQYLIPSKKKDIPATMLVCGTCDATVEYSQSVNFADAIKKKGGDVTLHTYQYYDHNLSSKTSDKMEEIFFLSVDFLKDKLGATFVPAAKPAKANKAAKAETSAATTAAKASSSIVTTSTTPVTAELNAMGIHTESPDSSAYHANNHFTHIVKTFDKELNRDVYSFIIHAKGDDDRGKTEITNRQRNEVKTDNKSPENLWAKEGETLTMKWKMRLPEGMQTTKKFTHIHQLKGIDNRQHTADVGTPLLTLTCYSNSNGKGQQLRLRYNDRNIGSKAVTLKAADLSDFLGRWVEIEETATFSANGAYSVVIRDVASGKVLFDYSDSGLDMWRTGAEGLRPKWGIYRWLGENREWENQLRDEELRYVDFEVIKK